MAAPQLLFEEVLRFYKSRRLIGMVSVCCACVVSVYAHSSYCLCFSNVYVGFSVINIVLRMVKILSIGIFLVRSISSLWIVAFDLQMECD